MKTNVIKELKDDKGLTYQQMAQLTGLHPMLIQQHCTGKKRISALSAEKYHKAFKISYKPLIENNG